MNTKRHTVKIGSAALALAFADVLAISQFRGQWEALIFLLPTVAAILLAAEAAKRRRWL